MLALPQGRKEYAMETKGITCKIPLELHQQASAMLAHPIRDHCLGGGRELFLPALGLLSFHHP